MASHCRGLDPGRCLEECGQLTELLVLLGHIQDAQLLQKSAAAWLALHEVGRAGGGEGGGGRAGGGGAGEEGGSGSGGRAKLGRKRSSEKSLEEKITPQFIQNLLPVLLYTY